MYGSNGLEALRQISHELKEPLIVHPNDTIQFLGVEVDCSTTCGEELDTKVIMNILKKFQQLTKNAQGGQNKKEPKNGKR